MPFTPATSEIASKNVLNTESRAESIFKDGKDSYTLKFFDVQKLKRLKAFGYKRCVSKVDGGFSHSNKLLGGVCARRNATRQHKDIPIVFCTLSVCKLFFYKQFVP